MNNTVTLESLKKVFALNDLPDEHLRWILDRGIVEVHEDGTLVSKYGESADHLWFIVEGKVAFYMNLNGRQVYFFTFENNNLIGGVSGMIPHSRLKTYPGYGYTVGKTTILKLHKDYFAELERLNPKLIWKLNGYMTERAKSFATTKLKYEKVSALGNLAAGIAHELNNPAAVINRISNELTERLSQNYKFTEDLLQCGAGPEHIHRVHKIVADKEGASGKQKELSALKKLQLQDEMDDWFSGIGIDNKIIAETFSEFGFTISEFEDLRSALGDKIFRCVAHWLENLINSRRTLADLAIASGRITDLVSAMKSHVQMDRAGEKQCTDIHKDIENTLTLLAFKLREKNIKVKKFFFSNLPQVSAYVGELNQVWTNLIDNAIYAMSKDGILSIETGYDGKFLYVSIVDNGPGIPEEIRSMIFDPFFTTKKVGEGTGIGLDLVLRIIKHHNGDIKVYSEPGRTEFTVSMPVE